MSSTWLLSAHQSTSFDRTFFSRRIRKFRYWAAAILALSTSAVSCTGESDSVLPVPAGSNGSSRHVTPEELEFRFIQAELALAGTRYPYLVIDPEREEIIIKQEGTIVWDCPFQPFSESRAGLETFYWEFRGRDDRLFRTIMSKHLFEALDRTPDSLLVVIGRVVRMDPELLQREIPGRFQLLWDGGSSLEIRTGVDGEPVSRFRNAIQELREWISRPFDGDISVVTMDPEDALTLYHVSARGMPTLILPTSGIKRAQKSRRQ